jgi:hypothetical protein
MDEGIRRLARTIPLFFVDTPVTGWGMNVLGAQPSHPGGIMRISLRLTVPATTLTALLLCGTAYAHSERPFADFGPRPGALPNINRHNPTTLVVCKPSSRPTLAQHADIHSRLPAAQAEETAWHRNAKLFRKCRYEHIQAAVDAAGNDTTILVMPGVYREEPSRAQPTSPSGDNLDGTYSYAWHLAHPNDANLIGIIGKTNITLEGTGATPRDVLIDAGFVKDVGVRADRADGVIVRNLWERDANEHGIYVVESDGYIFDRTIGSYNHEYQLFSFASDHGLYTDCEAEGGSDSGIYIGGHPDTHLQNRFSATIQRCKMHDNALGFSGTQGNSVRIVDSDAYNNAIGISFDSEVDHPNFPQSYSVVENCRIHDNNYDVYAAGVDTPVGGPGYSFFRYPVGTGIWFIGGEHNILRNNYIYNNGRFGVVFAGNPFETHPILGAAAVRYDEVDGNFFGIAPDSSPGPNLTAFPPGGAYPPGGSDLFWDETGGFDCADAQNPASPSVKFDPSPYPSCPNPNPGPGLPAGDKLFLFLSCLIIESPPASGNFVTADTFYPCPWGHANLSGYYNRDQRECGNSIVDLGEDCDGGYGGGAAGETCQSLGLGPDASGPLACNADCSYNTGGCTAPVCGRVRQVSVGVVDGAGSGDDRLAITLKGLDGTGRTFDPATEGIDITFRDDTRLTDAGVTTSALYYQGRVAGGSNWSSTPTRRLYFDRAAATDGVVVVDLKAPSGFGSTFNAAVKVRNASVPAGTLAARTGTVVVRIGDDCWTSTAPCATHRNAMGCSKRPPLP